MSELDWNEVDDRYAERRSESVPFSDVLYGFNCPDCEEEVWSDGCDMDPDSPRWLFKCHECERRFSMSPETATIDMYKEE